MKITLGELHYKEQAATTQKDTKTETGHIGKHRNHFTSVTPLTILEQFSGKGVILSCDLYHGKRRGGPLHPHPLWPQLINLRVSTAAHLFSRDRTAKRNSSATVSSHVRKWDQGASFTTKELRTKNTTADRYL